MMTQRNRRETEWFTLQRAFADLAPDGQTNETLFNAISIGGRFIKGTTITRMIIDMTFRNQTAAQDNIATWGILVMNADARAAGAFPEADDVSDRAGWMIRAQELFNAVAVASSSDWKRTFVDLKSQRLLRTEEDELQLIIDNRSGSFTFAWAAYIRVLVKWP